MKFPDLIRIVIKNLKRMKLRTALTVIGVIVGTAAIVTLVGIGIGFQKSITSQFEEMGMVKTIVVFPESMGRAFAMSPTTEGKHEEEMVLDDKAIKKIEKIEGVEGVSPVLLLTNAKLQIGNYISQASLMSVNDDMMKQDWYNMESGEILKEKDLRAINVGNKVDKTFYNVNTGKSVSEIELLGEKGKLIAEKYSEGGVTSVTKFPVKIVGILKELGPDDDLRIYIPFELAKRLEKMTGGALFAAKEGEYTQLMVFAESVEKVDRITEKLNEMGFTAMSAKQMLGVISTIFLILRAVLGVLGAIALFVAAIGIVNTLVMSIYERFREIGIMKAIGASNKDISKIFLYEAGSIGFMGGVLGVITGFILGKVLNAVASYFINIASSEGYSPFAGMNLFEVPLWLFFGTILFAIVIGIIAGVYPARRAARLDPIDALRHE
ncbi:MAG: ABC transporter permease [Actinobacteria bacterium]|nr:ABC transporter permease [Actinomycetota bacterium]